MKILKNGTLISLDNKQYQMKCNKCNCEFVFTKTDIKETYNHTGSYLHTSYNTFGTTQEIVDHNITVECPYCHSILKLKGSLENDNINIPKKNLIISKTEEEEDKEKIVSKVLWDIVALLSCIALGIPLWYLITAL